ncbi:4'-phosphopantetheinyl transferase superfamily protein [Pendulispora brunnea]|uniref:Enterobactin synthase component D n=1 Tax=Pendulispora brunnea TaxID=2905690 RepID=A0ABZ2KC74_9BACT
MVVSGSNVSLFPAFVAHHSVAFDREVPSSFSEIPIPESIQNAPIRRQVEFRAGRECARRALKSLMKHLTTKHLTTSNSLVLGDAAIAVGSDREPVWPEGIVGAITHTNELASAAVARASDTRGIGLDVEVVMSEENAASWMAKIAAPHEVAELARAMNWSPATALTVIFSAKETLYKCLYPQVRRYFGFRAAAIESADASGYLSVRLLETLTPELVSGCSFEGRFEICDGLVRTGMVLPSSADGKVIRRLPDSARPDG